MSSDELTNSHVIFLYKKSNWNVTVDAVEAALEAVQVQIQVQVGEPTCTLEVFGAH